MPRSHIRGNLHLAPAVSGAHLMTAAFLVALFAADFARADPPRTNHPQEKKFMNEVTGEFEVKIVPHDTGDDKMGMMTLDKHYHGDLNATGQGRMLTGMTDVKGSAAYVAIERVQWQVEGARGDVSHAPHGSHEQRLAIARHFESCPTQGPETSPGSRERCTSRSLTGNTPIDWNTRLPVRSSRKIAAGPGKMEPSGMRLPYY